MESKNDVKVRFHGEKKFRKSLIGVFMALMLFAKLRVNIKHRNLSKIKFKLSYATTVPVTWAVSKYNDRMVAFLVRKVNIVKITFHCLFFMRCYFFEVHLH